MSVLPVEDPLGNAASSVFISHRLSTDPGSLHLRSHASLARKAAVAQLPFVGQAANYKPLYLLLPPRLESNYQIITSLITFVLL